MYQFYNYMNLARNFNSEKNYLKALKFYKKAYKYELGKKDIELLLDMAILYDKTGDKGKAEEKYREVIKIDNNDARAYYGLGVLYDEDGFYDDALEYYGKAIEIDENYDKAYFFIANIYDEMGKKEEAINYYKKVLKINPKDLWANANIGCIYEELNEIELGMEYMKKALEINPNHFRILFNMGVFSNKQGKTLEASEYYNKSLKENNEFPYTYLNLSLLYKENDIEKTIEIISEGIDNNEREGFLYYNRACFYSIKKDYEKAILDLNKAIELNDFFYEYMKKDRELDVLREEVAYKKIIEKLK